MLVDGLTKWFQSTTRTLRGDCGYIISNTNLNRRLKITYEKFLRNIKNKSRLQVNEFDKCTFLTLSARSFSEISMVSWSRPNLFLWKDIWSIASCFRMNSNNSLLSFLYVKYLLKVWKKKEKKKISTSLNDTVKRK